VKELKQPKLVVKLDQRRHGRMSEPAIRCGRKPLQVGRWERVVRKQRDQIRSKVRVRQTGIPAQSCSIEIRHDVRDIKSAILGEAGEQHVFERETSRLWVRIASAEITHEVVSDQDAEPIAAPSPPQPEAGAVLRCPANSFCGLAAAARRV
jgi:hypothetical protein